MRNSESNRGSIILETSIVLPIFMMVIFFIYGLFAVSSTQNQMTHALIQSSKSLSLDPYLTEHVDSAAEAKTFWSGLGSMVMDFVRLTNDDHFYSNGDWYKGDGSASLAQKRFVGYFAGGDDQLADQKLKSLGIKDGLNGVSFKMSIDGEMMTITIKYTIQFWIDAFNLGKIPMEQSITTRLWK